jgi:asparagine synthase (glutamine-hydrolysing)
MLTLRYDPQEKPYIKKTKYKQWIPSIYETTAISLERKLINALAPLENCNRIGIALSSGVDSVLLLRLIRFLYPSKEIIAFHYNNEGKEIEDAKVYADEYGAEFVVINNESILKNLQWQVSVTGEPMWDAFDYVIYETAKHFKCDVLVDGSGADELFGGYTFRYSNFNPTSSTTEALFYGYMDVHNRDWVDDQAHMFGPEIKFNWDDIRDLIGDAFGNNLPTICQLFLADYNGKLAHLFTKKQAKYQNIYDITPFSPYLNRYVAEYGMLLEPNLKISGVVGKLPLRQIAARYDLAVTPKKYGFSHDTVKEWNNPKYHEEAVDDLIDHESQIYAQGIISYEWAMRHISSETDRYDVRYVNKFFQLLALEQWLRKRMHMDY